MKRISYLTIILLPALLALRCSKETYEVPQRFATIRFNNQTGLPDLKLTYNQQPYTNGNLNNVRIPAGSGEFAFVNPLTRETLLDTVLAVEAGTDQELVLFKPGADAPMVMMRNTQLEEPKPDSAYMKVKIANLATQALPGRIDIVFYAFDDNYYDFMPLDTLRDVPRGFPDAYVTLRNATSLNAQELMVKIIDADTQEPLHDFWVSVLSTYDPNTWEFYSVFVFYLVDDADGTQIYNSPHKVFMGTLFHN